MAISLEHTTDTVFSVQGRTLKGLFANALYEMNGIMRPGYCREVRHSDCCMHVSLTSRDAKSLMLEFLSEALSLTHIQKALFCYVYFIKLSEYRLQALLFGRWYDHLENDIRAVIPREAKVRRLQGGGWESTISCDL